MKNTISYVACILFVIVLIPLIIVKGCCTSNENKGKLDNGLKIKVYIKEEKKVEIMDLEEYIKEVVAAEMPAGFEEEALKAQAVAARTYAFSRMKKLYNSNDGSDNGADICTDPGHCQAWVSKKAVLKRWGLLNSRKNWSKIETAVNETRNQIIIYKGTIANPLFHSNSGGRTENSEDVWDGVYVPYLRSVESEGEDDSPEYKSSLSIKTSDFINKIKGEYSDFKINNKDIMSEIKILDVSEGGRVKSIQIGNRILKGTDLRTMFSLKSTNFSIENDDGNSLKITTIGNGHGVGMSQWGADHLAKLGENYEDILKYYYKGIEISTTDKF